MQACSHYKFITSSVSGAFVCKKFYLSSSSLKKNNNYIQFWKKRVYKLVENITAKR